MEYIYSEDEKRGEGRREGRGGRGGKEEEEGREERKEEEEEVVEEGGGRRGYDLVGGRGNECWKCNSLSGVRRRRRR